MSTNPPRLHTGALARTTALSGVLVMACVSDDAMPPVQTTGSTSASASSDSSGSSATGVDAETSEPTTGEPAGGWEPSVEVGQEIGAFFSVWGPEPGLVYAVAGQPLGGGVSEGAILRWEGSGWNAHAVPEGVPGLNWVFGVGTRRFAVGELGTLLVRDGDEGEWTQYSCETVLPFWGAWGAGPDDVWAVGGDGFNRDPFACHWDGVGWTQSELPEASFETHALYKVWGTASDDVWAVGQDGLLMHWGGEAEGWSEVPSDTDFDLISLWGTGPNEILAVGGRTTGVLSRWDGTTWTAQEVPEVPGLNGVWMAADGTATVVGPQGGAGVVAPGALTVEREDTGTPLALHAVFGFDDVERWAVGGSLDQAPPYIGIILHRAP